MVSKFPLCWLTPALERNEACNQRTGATAKDITRLGWAIRHCSFQNTTLYDIFFREYY